MKWLFTAKKAARRILSSQQYHLHGGSRSRFIHTINNIGWSNLHPTQSSSVFYCNSHYSTSTLPNTMESSYRLMNGKTQENNTQKVDLEVISKDTIKPTCPTPHHLRTFNLSIIDQMSLDIYTPLILFLPNTNKASVTDVVTKRSKHLKEALSQILTQFYPLAGKVIDNWHIECNDEGVYYTEARVNQALNDFLSDPDDLKVRELMPEHPRTSESFVRNFLIGVQVNIFSCGGIGIGTNLSHKIFDGQTYYTFMKAWAEAARGSPQTISPSFVASKIFPGNPCKGYLSSSKFLPSKSTTTKRFVFNSNVLTLLKSQPVACSSSSRAPTRMEATTAVIWKAAAKAASSVRSFSPESPYVLFPVVNLRKRASPPLPDNSFGNVIFLAGVMCLPERQPDLPTLMGELRESIAKLSSDHIESMKGEKGHKTFDNILNIVNHLTEVTREGDCLFASSLLNSGMYELDFGWGKPIWFYAMNSGVCRMLHLNDMLKGGGVEAIVTLSPEEMEIFERDPELLSYATANPSPLQILNN